jgi:hypothetical protein
MLFLLLTGVLDQNRDDPQLGMGLADIYTAGQEPSRTGIRSAVDPDNLTTRTLQLSTRSSSGRIISPCACIYYAEPLP